MDIAAEQGLAVDTAGFERSWRASGSSAAAARAATAAPAA